MANSPELRDINDDLNEWNPRNELRLPLKLTTNIENIDLDCSTPRIKAAMKNLGVRQNELQA